MKKKKCLAWLEIILNVVTSIVVIYCIVSWLDVVINNMGGTIAWWNLFHFVVRGVK